MIVSQIFIFSWELRYIADGESNELAQEWYFEIWIILCSSEDVDFRAYILPKYLNCAVLCTFFVYDCLYVRD